MSVTANSQRKDARRNHEVILEAARQLFAEQADVPMCDVAKAAGVGQATLYRHFPHRRDLVAALLAERMQATEAIAAEHAADPDALLVLLRSITTSIANFYALGQLAREDSCLDSMLKQQRRRLSELMERPLSAAKAAGLLRPDIVMDDLFLVIAAIRGAMDGLSGPVARAEAGVRALTFVLEGLTVPAASRA